MNTDLSPLPSHPAYRYGCLAVALLSVALLILRPPMRVAPIPGQEPEPSQNPRKTAAVQVDPQPPVMDKTPEEAPVRGGPTLEEYTRCLARELELDETLAVALLLQESDARDPMKRGPRGGRGPLQIRPVALEEVGLSRSEYALPVLVYGGLSYLKTMLSRFDDMETALAAYNMGPTRLEQRAYRPYRTTQHYVRQVLRQAGRIRSGHTPFYPVLNYPLSQPSDLHELAPVRVCLVFS